MSVSKAEYDNYLTYMTIKKAGCVTGLFYW